MKASVLLEDEGPLARLAVTVVVVRPAAEGDGFEVLLSERGRGAFARGLWVFPGGRVDADDGRTVYSRHPTVRWIADRFGITLAKASSIVVGALRELAEEAAIVDPGPRARTLELDAWRRVRAGEFDRTPTESSLFALARWLPPRVEMRRFDTFFLVCEVPAAIDVRADGDEILSHRWITPRDAIDAYGAAELPLLPPTCRTLGELAAFPTWALLRAALEAHWPPTNAPIVRAHDDVESQQIITELPLGARPGLDGESRFAYRFDGGSWHRV